MASDPQRPAGVAAAFAPALVDASATPMSWANDSDTYALFFYGTLIHPAILAKVIGNAGAHVEVCPAVLPGYALHHVRGEDYPGLVPQHVSEAVCAARKGPISSSSEPRPQPQPLKAVRGTLARGLRLADVRRLDAFEGDEYKRVGVYVLPDKDVPALRNDQRPRDASMGQVLATLTPTRIDALISEGAKVSTSTSTSTEHHQPTGEHTNVYLWNAAPLDTLEADIWSFETFTASGKDRRWWA